MAAVCLLSPRAEAQGPLVRTDVSHHGIVLTSRGEVQTWETEGVKVFVAAEGGEVRQGPVRITGAALVVWFDKERSQSPDVRAALVRVYAEGAGEPGKEPTEPACLVEGRNVREGGLIRVNLRSKLAFAWDCPLVSVEHPEALPLYVRAEAETKEARAEFIKEKIPEAAAVEWKEMVIRTLKAEEMWAFGPEEGQKSAMVWVGLGDVRASYSNVDVSADVAVVWIDERAKTYEIYARGNVFISRTEGAVEGPPPAESLELVERFQSIRADEVYIHAGRGRGLASRAEFRFWPPEADVEFEDVYVVRGREVYILDAENLYIREGSFTTCPFGHPHYQITAEKIRLVRQEPMTYVTGWHPKMRWGKQERTLVALPFLSADVGKREGFLITRLAVGSSKKFGSFIQTRWRPMHLGLAADWVEDWDWTVDLDYYGDRGPAVGTELEYEFARKGGDRHFGDITAYYVRDSGDEDDTGLPVPKEDRGRFQRRHRAQWDERWRTDMEFYWLSDVAFLREYFEEEFEDDRPPESYMLTRYRKDSLWAGILVKKRVNHFLTQTEELPSLELQWIGLPVGGPVYDASFEAGVYDLDLSDVLAAPDPSRLFRAHTEQRISWPFSVDFVRVDPFLRLLATWASRGAFRAGDWTGSQSRIGAGGGLRASADFSRSYDAASKLFALNRLRHIVTPFVEFETLPTMSGDSSDFIQLDMANPWPTGGRGLPAGADWIDAIDKRTELKLGARQRLQTKRGGPGNWQTVDWIELDLAFVMRSDDSVAVVQDDNYIQADFNWQLTPNFSIHSQDNRVSLQGGVDVWNLGSKIDFSKTSGLAVDYFQFNNVSSTVKGKFWTRLSDRYGLMIEETYEFDALGPGDDQNMETQILLRRFFHKWVFDIGVHYEKANDEMALLFGFAPMSRTLWGASPVGLGLRGG